MSGAALLTAGVLAGLLWDGLGAPATFIAGTAFCVLTFRGSHIAAIRSQ